MVNCDVSSLHHRIAGMVSSTHPRSPVAGQAVQENRWLETRKELVVGGERGGGRLGAEEEDFINGFLFFRHEKTMFLWPLML